MNIRQRLTLRFVIIVASILAGFSFTIYVLSERYRREEFFSRLEGRAITTARLLVNVQEVDLNLLRIIDKNSIHALFEEKVVIFGASNQVLYSSLDDFEVNATPELLDRIRKEGKIEYTHNNYEHLGMLFVDPKGDVVVIASAYDRYGRSKLANLRTLLISGLVIGLILIFIAGNIFAEQAMAPLARLNSEISSITAGNLSQRVDEGNRHDEIAQLAMNFNAMLERLEAAFAIQQQFVSNASHELRTPLAALSGQLQATLEKQRTPEEYRKVLKSLSEDTRELVGLTNGLLTLAQSGIDRQRHYFNAVRVDEVLYSAQQELSNSHPEYHFQIEFDDLPDDEQALTVSGNEQLLRTVFINLMDNACKYSRDKTVAIRFSFQERTVLLYFRDQGIGIRESDREKIFLPFYRGHNAVGVSRGYGIGLSLCLRIVQLHGGQIHFESGLNKGSVFQVVLPSKA